MNKYAIKYRKRQNTFGGRQCKGSSPQDYDCSRDIRGEVLEDSKGNGRQWAYDCIFPDRIDCPNGHESHLGCI